MSYECKHGEDMCDQCMDILEDGKKQGREEERNNILALLEDHDSGYNLHSGCRLCEVIRTLKGETDPHTWVGGPESWPKGLL